MPLCRKHLAAMTTNDPAELKLSFFVQAGFVNTVWSRRNHSQTSGRTDKATQTSPDGIKCHSHQYPPNTSPVSIQEFF